MTVLAVQSPEIDRQYFRQGFISALIGHVVLFILVLLGSAPYFSEIGKPIIYSVSIEGGKSLGGISQVPKDEKKVAVAPPKKVAGDVQQKVPEVKPEKADVSLADKKKKEEIKKATPKPTVKPTPKKASSADINKQLSAAVQRYLGESSDAGGKGFGAGSLGGNKMGGGLVRPPAFFIYRDLLKNHIKSGWRWYDTSAALQAEIIFEIQPDGSLINVRIGKGSGNAEFDNSVLRAVLRASPVPPPPQEVYEPFFKYVTMTFDPRE